MTALWSLRRRQGAWGSHCDKATADILGPRRFARFGAPRIDWSRQPRSNVLVQGCRSPMSSVRCCGYSFSGLGLVLGRLPSEERLPLARHYWPSALAIITARSRCASDRSLVGAGLGYRSRHLHLPDARGPQNYERRSKAMRKGDYQSAITSMSTEIRERRTRRSIIDFAPNCTIGRRSRRARADTAMTELDERISGGL